MSDLIQHVNISFEQVLGYAPSHIIQAPSRVNLISEHTYYNDGFVLPCAINYQTVVAAAKCEDNLVRVVSVEYGTLLMSSISRKKSHSNQTKCGRTTFAVW